MTKDETIWNVKEILDIDYGQAKNGKEYVISTVFSDNMNEIIGFTKEDAKRLMFGIMDILAQTGDEECQKMLKNREV